ncbi:iron-containing redox enzyme family protein [Nocardia sp. NPDC057353]|uniref:iron-containing redox enzyme family protein n=1 Tax=Nocardia sp. NPDC057353 TaxID=3346104 RepID=UPI0036301C08
MTTSVRTRLALPRARGALSSAVLTALRSEPGTPVSLPAGDVDPYGDDLHLALYTLYELHYQGFDGVASGWEWDPGLLAFRAELERRFLAAMRADVPGGADLDAELNALLVQPGEPAGVGAFLLDEAEWWHVREYFVHRSIYHHKEADPYAWAIPRLRGQSKASLVAVEFDEYGGGHADRVHARLYADLMAAAGLNDEYLHYLDVVPAPMLALVNMMSLFGLHRELRGALVGHFATVEITSSPGSRRMVSVLERLEADPACVRFYAEHVEADAVHEQVMRHQVIAPLVAEEPELTESVVFGIQVTNLLEEHVDRVLLEAWGAGKSSLLEPLE